MKFTDIVAEKMVNVPIIKALYKWVYFERAKHILKILLLPSIDTVYVKKV